MAQSTLHYNMVRSGWQEASRRQTEGHAAVSVHTTVRTSVSEWCAIRSVSDQIAVRLGAVAQPARLPLYMSRRD